MGHAVYNINKGINKSIEFKGLKAQYIWWLGGGLVILLVLFAVMYLIGISTYICLGLVLLAGGSLFSFVYRMSKRFGEHGMMKMMASRNVPELLELRNRKLYFRVKDTDEVINAK